MRGAVLLPWLFAPIECLAVSVKRPQLGYGCGVAA